VWLAESLLVIGKLGPLEYVLNTPSQHRVHHGKNVYCIDKNYGGTLCIFDRLFGTFQEELDQVRPIATHFTNKTRN
jgi:alkylglycerol monooxygenase